MIVVTHWPPVVTELEYTRLDPLFLENIYLSKCCGATDGALASLFELCIPDRKSVV